MFGGGDGDLDFDDVYAFHIPTGYWDKVTNITGPRESRSQGTCTATARPHL